MDQTQQARRQEALWKLHDAITAALLARLSSGDASSSDTDVTIKFLRNNGITAEFNPHAAYTMRALNEALNVPFQGGVPAHDHTKETHEQ